MKRLRATLREVFLFALVVGLAGLFAYPLLATVGAIGWGLVGEWLVRYDDQYEWVTGCVRAGGYLGWSGVLWAAWAWIGYRFSDRRRAPASDGADRA